MKFTFPPESRPLAGFTLKRAIYRGGFGEVYYGLTDAGREVALKLLQHNTEVELRGVQQCLNLSHPNLVTIFDVKQDEDGDHWIVMEYIAGETLESTIRKSPQGLPLEVIRQWLPGITAGIGFLHRHGLVHRDLKPANLFIENGIVKIGDIGLSKFISPSRHSAHTQSVGTVYYMSPEVAKGRYGKAVDIYALGIILYEMLTGDLPFNGESTGEILMKHLTEMPDLKKIPASLRPVIGRALEKDAALRFATAADFQQAFDAAVRQHTVLTSQPAGSSFQQQTTTSTAGPARSNGHCRPIHKRKKPGFSVDWAIPLAMIIALGFLKNSRSPVLATVIFALGLLVSRLIVREKYKKSAAQAGLSPRTPLTRPPRSTDVTAAAALHSQRTFHAGLQKGLTACLVSVPFVAVLGGVLAALRPSLFMIPGGAQIEPGLLGFFLCVCLLSTWGILLTTVPRHSARRKNASRWEWAVTGALIGLIAAKLGTFLMVELPLFGDLQSSSMVHHIGELPLSSLVSGPTLAGYLVFFTTFFALRKWNQMTSPLRSKRFSVGAVFLTLLTAWLTTKVFDFPSDWALAWGAIIACSVQLASPWHDEQRPHAMDHSL